MKANAVDALGPAGRLSRRGLEISASVLLLLYIVAIVVSFPARLSATGDMRYRVPIVHQGEESLVFTSSAGRNWQFIQYGATLASSMLIVAAAAIVFRVFSAYEPTLALIGSFMMVGAALFAGLFAIAGLILAQGYIGPVVVQDDMEQILGSRELYDVFVPILILSEKIWLTFAALGGIAYGALIAWTRAPRWLGWGNSRRTSLAFNLGREHWPDENGLAETFIGLDSHQQPYGPLGRKRLPDLAVIVGGTVNNQGD